MYCKPKLRDKQAGYNYMQPHTSAAIAAPTSAVAATATISAATAATTAAVSTATTTTTITLRLVVSHRRQQRGRVWQHKRHFTALY